MTIKHEVSDAEALALVEGDDTAWAPPVPATEKLEIQAAVRLVEQAQALLDDTVIRARRNGLVWFVIGDALGVSGEAARKKYGPRVGDAR